MLGEAVSVMDEHEIPEGATRTISRRLGWGIFIMPYVFSWFTLRRGYTQRAKLVAFGWLGIFVVAQISARSDRASHTTGSNTENSSAGAFAVAADTQPNLSRSVGNQATASIRNTKVDAADSTSSQPATEWLAMPIQFRLASTAEMVRKFPITRDLLTKSGGDRLLPTFAAGLAVCIEKSAAVNAEYTRAQSVVDFAALCLLAEDWENYRIGEEAAPHIVDGLVGRR
jgi:hypothetical protein